MSLSFKVIVSHTLHRNPESLIPILWFCDGIEHINDPELDK